MTKIAVDFLCIAVAVHLVLTFLIAKNVARQNQKLTGLEDKLTSLEDKLTGLEDKLTGFQNDMQEIQQSIPFIRTVPAKFLDVQRQFNHLQSVICSGIEPEIDFLRQSLSDLKNR